MDRPFLGQDVDELVRTFVRPGMHLHFAATMSRPNALLNAVCRVLRGHGNLTVSTTAVHSNAHALALSGAVRHVVTCFLGDTYPTPRPNRLYRNLANNKPFSVEPWSLSTYQQRLVAGATGQPYAVTTSLIGSDLVKDKGDDLHIIDDPARPGQTLALITPLRPDLTLVHGVCADRRGNVVMCPPIGEGPWAAYAATGGVLASVERIVPDEVIDAMPDRVVIPARCVVGLCEARLGAHPQSLRTDGLAGVPGYLDDYEFLEEIVEECRQGRSGEWFDTWIAGPDDHTAYLAALGPERIASLLIEDRVPDVVPRGAELPRTPLVRPCPTTAQGTARRGIAAQASTERSAALQASAVQAAALQVTGKQAVGNQSTATHTAATQSTAKHATVMLATDESMQVTDQERLIVLGARAIVDLVADGAYNTLLAGIGTSHMAAWLAAELLRRRGTPVCVAAELGLVDLSPHPGDVFLFSQRHAARSTQLAGISEVLGADVAGNPQCLGVLSAAEIDEHGNINTTLLPDGRWITGSGGANDIASGADCLVVAPASPRRYVRGVAYLTSPGRRVVEVASQFGRFRRNCADDPFELATWCPQGAPESERSQTPGAPGPQSATPGHRPGTAEPVAPEELIGQSTSWTPRVSTHLLTEPAITSEEIAVLRDLDPEGRYR